MGKILAGNAALEAKRQVESTVRRAAANRPSGPMTIKNTSEYPDWFVKAAAEFFRQRLGIRWKYAIRVVNTSYPGQWSGLGGTFECYVRCPRRFPLKFPHIHRDHRIKHCPGFELRGGHEVFLFLLAHEMFHATPDDRVAAIVPGGRRSEISREFVANRRAYDLLEAWRREWPSIRRRHMNRQRPANRQQPASKCPKKSS